MFNRSINSDGTSHDGAPPGERTTEQAILDAAERLFLEKGFARTSTTEIAREAGCNQALVHYYFRTKDRLFESIFERKALLMFSSLLSGGVDAPVEDLVANLVRTHFDILAENPRIPALIVNELSVNPERLVSLRTRIGRIPAELASGIQDRLDRAAATGAIRPVRVFELLLSVVSLNAFPFLGLPVFRTLLDLDEAAAARLLRERREENVRLVLAGLRPDAADRSASPRRERRTNAGRTAKGRKA